MNRVDLSKAIKVLHEGGVIVYPTDTLYALGADIFNENAVRKVFEIKKRPWDNPLPVAVSSFKNIEDVAFMNKSIVRLAECFLPGALTLILNKKSSVPTVVTGGLEKVAVRIPDNKVALEILSKFGPLTVTSANIHGEKTLGLINDIKTQFNVDDVAVYLDYGELHGLPSTIVDMTMKEPKIIREGAITKSEIMDMI
jgi:L-threonylcarbamoyladenylate synthase